MDFVILNINGATFRDKMIGLDYDWTLVNPKEGRTFPKSVDDWTWFNSSVPNKIKEYYDNNFMVVIFTNQSKEWKCEQIKMVAEQLKVPLFVAIAMKKEIYKPNTFLYEKLFEDATLNKNESLFIGDALGRKNDFSDSDKVFAENIGIKYFPPEEIFIDQTIDFTKLPELTSSEPEIIIMVGYPGSGKSTVAKNITNYVWIEGDVYKTSSKMIKKATELVKDRKSVIFDATNSSIKKRNEYIQFAKKYGYKVKCIHMTTSNDESYKRNLKRPESEKVPKIAYSVYNKYYEEPQLTEGIDEIIKLF